MFTVLGWVLVATGAFIAWRFGWRDPGKGTRRCPKCGYDMTATAGMPCPECGHKAANELRLFRPRRRWRWMFAGGALLLASYPVSKWPLYATHGWIGFAPRVLTLAALPEVLAWSPYLTRGKPLSLFRTVGALAKVQAFDRAERYALATAYRRMLDDPARRQQLLDQFFIVSQYIGDQAPTLAPTLTALLDEPTATRNILQGGRNFPATTDPRMAAFATRAAQKLRDIDEITPALPTLDHLAAWGCPMNELRATATDILRRPVMDTGETLEFLWRHQLLTDADAEEVVRACLAQRWPLANHGARAALDVPRARSLLLPDLIRELDTRINLQTAGDWTMLAAACTEQAALLLPILDRHAESHQYVTVRVCARIAALSLRGRGVEAYELWRTTMSESDDADYRHKPLRYHVCLLILSMDIPDDLRADGIAHWIDLTRSGVTPNSVPGPLLTAIDAAGRVGPRGTPALDALISVIQPNSPAFVVERSLASIRRIANLDRTQRETLRSRYARWKTMPIPLCDGHLQIILDQPTRD